MARYGTVKNQMKELEATASQQPQEIRERRTAAEGLLGSLEADIGAPGTYDLPGSSPAPPAAPPAGPAPSGLLNKDGYKFGTTKDVKKYDKLIKKGYSAQEAADQLGMSKVTDEDSIFKNTKTGVGIKGMGGKGSQMTTSLDPDKAKAQLESSSAFRQVSRMAAESEQMLARSGPLYDEMMRSTQLPIIEGAAAASRENTENIRRAMAKGGAARRDAFGAIAKIRAQDQINMTKGQQLADAHLNMDKWVRENAKEVINFAHGWATNQAGIRESFQSAMDAATHLMSTVSLPFIFDTQQKEQEYRDAASAQQRGKVNKWITAVVGVAGGLMSSYSGGSGAGLDALSTGQFAQSVKSNAKSGAQALGEGIGSTYAGIKKALGGDEEAPAEPVVGREIM